MKASLLTRVSWGALITAIYIFLLAPLLVVFVISFDTRPYLSFPPAGFSFGSYIAVAKNEGFVRAFGVSLLVGVVSALLALAAGVPAALLLTRQKFAGRGALSALFLSPLLVPHIVLAVGILLVLAPVDLLDSYTGLIMAHVGITIPYVIRTVSLSLASIDPASEESARVHGASAITVFRRVTLPLAAPGLLAGGVIAFLVSFDEAVIALFIATNRVSTLPLAIYHYIEFRTDPQIAALSVILIMVSMLLMVLVERVVGLRRALKG
ncbi:ABC transporter permease [Humitalea sp. 24SJ18S-53]|uniref:ABC transporter permease n=1 Tax=Humitalea sp. 24SJ18S-53 TaxID=3422307 RepID=UPI003D66C754